MFIHKTKKMFTFFLTSFCLLVLVSCGSDGAPNDTGTITGGNQKSLNSSNAVAVTDTALSMIGDSMTAGQAIDIARAFNGVPGGAMPLTADQFGCATTAPGTLDVTSSVGSFVVVFKDYCIQSPSKNQATINGTVSINVTGMVRSMQSTDLTVTVATVGTYLINIDIIMDPSATPRVQINEFNYSDPDGVVHDLSDMQTVSSNTNNGVDVTNGSFTHPKVGTVTVNTIDSLEFNCNGRQPSAGKISIAAEDGSNATVTFVNCETYTIEIDGVVIEKTWPAKPGNPGSNNGGLMSINATNESLVATNVTAGVAVTDNMSMAINTLIGSNVGAPVGGFSGSTKTGSCGGDRTIQASSTGIMIMFNDYCEDVVNVGQVVVAGSLTMTVAMNGFSVSGSNLSVSIDGSKYMVMIDVSMDKSATPAVQINTLSYTGPDGITHDISNLQSMVAGAGSLNFADIGKVDVTINQPIEYNCPDSKPSAGEISIVAADGSSATISFSSCSGFTVMRDGVSTDYMWPTVPAAE